jgi:hypothetical protein
MTTYVIRNGRLIEKWRAPPLHSDSVQIMSDISPYRSMIDGRMVTSRSEHRTHLRDHGCIEVGNEKMETKYAKPDGEKRRQILHQQLSNMNDRQANHILSELRQAARR